MLANTIRVGTKVAFAAEFLGRNLSYVYEIVELILNQKLVMRTAEGPFAMETTYIGQAINNETTEMILINQGAPKRFSNCFHHS